MSLFNLLTTWYNLPFIAALACSLILMLLQMVGIGDGDGDADAEVGAPAVVELDAHAELDAHVEAHGDVHGHGDGTSLLSALGIGRVPLTMLLMIFLSCFGMLGLIGNTSVAQLAGSYPGLVILPVLALSLLLAGWLTGKSSRLLARMAPDNSKAISFEQLVGRVGVVTSPSVSPSYGRVEVRDPFGSLHTVFAVSEGDSAIAGRSEVALLSYDQSRRCFIVKAMG